MCVCGCVCVRVCVGMKLVLQACSATVVILLDVAFGGIKPYISTRLTKMGMYFVTTIFWWNPIII